MTRPGSTWLTVIGVLAGTGFASAEGSGALDPGRLNVCEAVPGTAVAGAFGLRLLEARAIPADADGQFARCVYRLAPPERPDGPVTALVLWIYRESAYDELLEVQDGPFERVSGIGDAAILFEDSDGRWKLRFVRRGRYTAEATGPDAESARKLARLALERLGGGQAK